jgi:hypothetical protein
MNTDDPIELIIGAGITEAGIRFKNQNLDFYLPDGDVLSSAF